MFEGIKPSPWMKSAANWFPGTEEVQPEEIRVTFIGTSPMIRPGQMNTSIYVELGNGDNFEFDIGEGSVANLYVTELQQEVVEIGTSVQGVPPFLARYTIDTHHTPAYAAGYVAHMIKLRMFMTTHMSYDPYVAEETVADVRQHRNGPYHFGAPDGIVVNMTKDQIWVREGILPDFPNAKSPQFDFTNGQLIVPHPPTSRQEIQEPFVREQQIDPELYYPEGYHPELLEDWPVETDLVVPVDVLPDNLKDSMGSAWRHKQKNMELRGE